MAALAMAILVASLNQATDSHRSCGTVDAPPSATLAQFTQLEEVWNQAYLRNDSAALDALWAERITVILDGKQLTKAEALSRVAMKRIVYTRYATSALKLQADHGIPIISGKLSTSRSVDGRAIDEVWLFKKVYQRGPFGCWQVVLYEGLNTRE